MHLRMRAGGVTIGSGLYEISTRIRRMCDAADGGSVGPCNPPVRFGADTACRREKRGCHAFECCGSSTWKSRARRLRGIRASRGLRAAHRLQALLVKGPHPPATPLIAHRERVSPSREHAEASALADRNGRRLMSPISWPRDGVLVARHENESWYDRRLPVSST